MEKLIYLQLCLRFSLPHSSGEPVKAPAILFFSLTIQLAQQQRTEQQKIEAKYEL